ncbi:DNA internalization-related competence protein ComEC/Rec2 [Candidatus Leptofilum sp.]|uniref:DNA internalization-related competence protein ComEC/Rec2 n=1 Tax=Candidatus Leptofilum sp. TaxID=3241576 RepID=UPI003B5C154C
MLLVYLGIAWFLGLWLGSIVTVDWLIWLTIAGVGTVTAVFLRRSQSVRWGAICLAALALGAIRYGTAVPTIDQNHIAYYNGTRNVTITGLVVDEPDVRDRFVNLRVAVDTIQVSGGAQLPMQGIVQVQTYRFPVINYGSRLRVTGILETPPEGETFSYRTYLARQGIHSLMSLPNVTVIAENEGNSLYQAIFTFKSRAQTTIAQLIPEPQAALLTGILLGNDNGLPPDLDEAFRITGMTHIIAISGFNVAILVAILVRLAEPFFSRRGAVIFALVGISLYTVLVGADASVVRAALMGGIYLIANRWLGRPNFAFASLFLAGFGMTLVRPFTLWDVGFQLSFAATLSLMLYADPLTQWTRRKLQRWLVRDWVEKVMGVLSEAVILTIAAQILTLPLIIGYFEQLSIISPLANALILPVQPAVMIWGGLATLVGLVLPAVGQLLAWVAWLFLGYTIWMVRLFAAVPGAAIPLAVSPGGVIAIFGVIGALTWLGKQPLERRSQIFTAVRQNITQRLAVGATGVTAVLILSWGLTQPDGQLHIAFLNVGQGDATFIQTPSGRQILVDGGLYPSILNDQLGQQMPFWDKEIDILVATHPDADHVSGLVGVFDRYHVNTLITNGQGFGESPIYDEVLAAAEKQQTVIRPVLAGEVIEIGDGVRLEVLHPGPKLITENRNENSVSMRLVYEDFTFLFTGDAEQAGEAEMLAAERPLTALVFKAGHHGSNSSSSLPFLHAVQPQIIIVSAGVDNRFGHPAPEMLERAQKVGAIVLRTDELGTITVNTDGTTMWWQANSARQDS